MAFTKSIEELIKEDKSGLLSKHESWERVSISDIANVVNGYAFKSSYFNNSGKGLPLIRIRDVVSGKTETFYDGPFDNIYVVNSGDFLIGMDGDFNCAFWRSDKALLNQRVCKVSLKNGHYSMKLLAYAMPHYLDAINANTSSMTVKHLSSKTVNEILLPLPPQNEQTRIVEKLEELLSDLDAGVAELKTAQTKLIQYRQSLLKSAVEGSLTADWRHNNTVSETGEHLLQRILKERRQRWETQKLADFEAKGKKPPKNWQDKYPEPVQPDTSELAELPEGWVWGSIAQLSSDEPYSLAIGPFGSNLKVADYVEEGVPLVFVRNIRSGNYGGKFTKFISKEKAIELSAHQVSVGDVLITKMGAPPGDADILPADQPDSIITADCIKVRCWDGLITPYFLKMAINSWIGKKQILPITKGVAQKKVSLARFSTLAIPLPSMDEQGIIIERLNIELDMIDAQVGSIELGLKQSEAQKKNLLRDAFSGKLTPQDPNDEPASILLEKIKADRAIRAKQPKTKRTITKLTAVLIMETLEQVLKNRTDWIDAQQAFKECGVVDGTDTDRIESLYAELRGLDKAGRLEVRRDGNYDMLRLKAE